MVFPVVALASTNAKTPVQTAAQEGRWLYALASATCPVNPNRALEGKVRSSEQPESLGLRLVRFSLGG